VALTTSDSYEVAKPRPCDVCGHNPAPGILRMRADRKWVCDQGCTQERVESEGALIAHDPLSVKEGSDKRALARLKELGVDTDLRYQHDRVPTGERIEVIVEAGAASVIGAGSSFSGVKGRLNVPEQSPGNISLPEPVGQETVIRSPTAQVPLGRKAKRQD
jgi:hypothetical protein